MNYELKQKHQKEEKDSSLIFHDSYFMIPNSFHRGQAAITAVIFFLIIGLAVSMGVLNPVLRQVKQADDFTRTRASLYVSESVNEDALYRLKTGKQFVSPSTLSLNGYSATATSTAVADGLQIDSSGNAFGLLRNIQTHLTSGSGTSFHYGMQSGEGGMSLNNSATIVGNVFSNGPITGANSNIIKGTVVSAGPSGIISGVHATSSAYAHTIQSADIDGDAYYQSISGSSVAGTLYPGSIDQATSSLPIPDSTIAAWEAEAVAGGTHTSPCPYSIEGSVTLGPKKINCDLSLSGDAVLTLTGPVWVVGNIDVSNQAEIRLASSLGSRSVALIADKPSALTSGSQITLSNTTEYYGSGDSNSFLLLVSQNKSAETGGSNPAITISNSAGGKLLLYAGHGLIQLSNSVTLKEVTAYKISVNNSAQVVYESGLANLLFSSGPAGGYVFDKWREVQ
ncbi:MAG: hypothetical protein Q7S86_03345 [bacterium]|nr:hypothetical protein [bacterium]